MMKILGFRSRIWSHVLACVVFLVLVAVTSNWARIGCLFAAALMAAEARRNYRIWGRG